MNQLQSLDESRVNALLSWSLLSGQTVSETEFLQEIRELPLQRVLPGLIRLLQHGDTSEPWGYGVLDGRVTDLFNAEMANRITAWLSQGRPWIFFSQWQLLFAIKLICRFGSRNVSSLPVTDNQFLRLLLMANDFYPQGEPAPDTAEGIIENLQRTALRGFSLIQREKPLMLIGRYAELFGRLAARTNRGDFNNWMDIQKVLSCKIGIQLDVFRAVLFTLYASSARKLPEAEDEWVLPELGGLNPIELFANIELPKEEVDRLLELVSTSPDAVKEDHEIRYGETIGNPVDFGILLRRPAITLPDGRLVGISGKLLIQRYTCGLYWDIHDALPDDVSAKPNRGLFQTFFGELHERYGRDILQRIERGQLRRRKKVRLMVEVDYVQGGGSNPDSLLIESLGNHKTRCTLFEFKVGRPRYKDSIVEADVHAFEEDLHRKIEVGLDQEIDFYKKVQSGDRSIPGLVSREIAAWFFVIVVTDPFPSMGMFLEPLRKKLATLPDMGEAKRYGPFIMSLMEIEQLETLPKWRVSQILMDWDHGPHRDWPFNTFYANLTRSQPTINRHVDKLADDDMERVRTTILGEQPPKLSRSRVTG